MPTKSRTASQPARDEDTGPATLEALQEQVDQLRAELASVKAHCGHQPVES